MTENVKSRVKKTTSPNPLAAPTSVPAGAATRRVASKDPDARNFTNPSAPLPELTPTGVEIVADNIRAVEAIYFASMLEAMRVFQVVERIVELFSQGLLPIGRGQTGNSLYAYWKGSAERLTEVQRRSLYASVFGFPSGDAAADAPPNREFNDLWLRFLAAVSAYARQLCIETKLPSDSTTVVGQEDVRRSARDLAANLSRHGNGFAFHAAKDLQLEIRKIIRLLSDAEIKSAFGARDMWQVIDQVSAVHLGGARNTARYRTQARSGSTIIRWTANHGKQLLRRRPVNILDDDAIRRRRITAGKKASTNPTDYDLVNAVEEWLAVSGGSNAAVEECGVRIDL